MVSESGNSALPAQLDGDSNLLQNMFLPLHGCQNYIIFFIDLFGMTLLFKILLLPITHTHIYDFIYLSAVCFVSHEY